MFRLYEASQTEIPPKLATIFTSLKASIINQHQHVAILLHYLMLEVGFILLPNSAENNSDNIVPSKECLRNNGSGFKFKYSFSNNNDIICLLQVLPNGAKVTIIGTFGGQPQKSFIIDDLPIEKYLLNINSQTFPSRFKNLNILSQEFKNYVALPLLSHLKDSLDLPPGTESLNVLSNEEIIMIISNLKCPKSLVNFGKCSARLNELSQKNSIWKELLKENFPRQYDDIVRESNENGQAVNWKSKYKRLYERNRESRPHPVMYQVVPVPLRPMVPLIPMPRPNIGPFRPRYDPPF